MICGGGADILKLLNEDPAKVLEFLNLIGRSRLVLKTGRAQKEREAIVRSHLCLKRLDWGILS